MIPLSFQLPAGAVLMAIGLAACFAGYRIFRTILTVYGIVLGGLFASTLFPPGNTTQLLIALLVGGLLGGVAMWVGYFVGVALVGAGLGAIAANSLWVHFRGEPSTAVIIVAAAVGAAMAVSWQRYVLIVGTAFIGSQTAVAGALALMNRGPRPQGETVWTAHFDVPTPGLHWTFLAWVALGAVGTLVQLRTGSKGAAPRRR
jgi:hypothetical protein